MKALAIDPGDKWIGIALSDGLKMTCKPYTTVELSDLIPFLDKLFKQEQIDTVVIGRPRRTTGEQSEQSEKTDQLQAKLEQIFSGTNNAINQPINHPITWIRWDERFSSQRATNHQQVVKKQKTVTKTIKTQQHALAAAFILQSYLDSKSF